MECRSVNHLVGCQKPNLFVGWRWKANMPLPSLVQLLANASCRFGPFHLWDGNGKQTAQQTFHISPVHRLHFMYQNIIKMLTSRTKKKPETNGRRTIYAFGCWFLFFILHKIMLKACSEPKIFHYLFNRREYHFKFNGASQNYVISRSFNGTSIKTEWRERERAR